jgi:hypothetical protein
MLNQKEHVLCWVCMCAIMVRPCLQLWQVQELLKPALATSCAVRFPAPLQVKDVEQQLPEKVTITIKCPMSAYQSAVYNWIKTTNTIRVDPRHRRAAHGQRPWEPLQNKVMELRKVCALQHTLLCIAAGQHAVLCIATEQQGSTLCCALRKVRRLHCSTLYCSPHTCAWSCQQPLMFGRLFQCQIKMVTVNAGCLPHCLIHLLLLLLLLLLLPHLRTLALSWLHGGRCATTRGCATPTRSTSGAMTWCAPAARCSGWTACW